MKVCVFLEHFGVENKEGNEPYPKLRKANEILIIETSHCWSGSFGDLSVLTN